MAYAILKLYLFYGICQSLIILLKGALVQVINIKSVSLGYCIRKISSSKMDLYIIKKTYREEALIDTRYTAKEGTIKTLRLYE